MITVAPLPGIYGPIPEDLVFRRPLSWTAGALLTFPFDKPMLDLHRCVSL